ncbi:putative transcriptional regulator [Salinibacter ruber]|uniref:CBS domain-containing protein n=1 Tax=Salinibacter ruber TaxID=146919 RepID=UPI0021670D6A|nr:CBS domain-containing protein [Salinibacter ruber]MCS3665628.1 putative transcriptional regulator [Salinibacter ruber]
MANNNAEEFLQVYRRIENFLRERQQAEPHVSFGALVDNSNISAVERYRYKLKRYKDLRNSIVHREREGGEPIADPRSDAVEDFRGIVENVTDPPGLSPFIHDVYTATPSDDIASVVKKMERDNFSQMPILESEGVIAVLTANTISRWIGGEMQDEEEGLLVTETSVEHVLPHAERGEENHTFLPRDASLYEAHEAFQAEENLREPPDAVLITHNGQASESLLGIITPFDLPELVSRI